jgi:dTDP-4-dehydrorhamnose reductase
LDITVAIAVEQFVSVLKPDVIINAAAYTAVDKAESEVELAYAVNQYGVAHLAKAAAKHEARLIQVSTDFVFDGRHSTPYRPDDQPNPLGVYGASKLAGEKAAIELCNDVVIVRTAWVYSSHGHNFVKTMLKLMAERESLSVVDDQIGTPTWARNLAEVIWKICLQPDIKGIYHYTDAGVASWYDFACAIQEGALSLGLLERQIPISPIPSSAYPTPAKRPAYSVLDKQPLLTLLNYDVIQWRRALRSMLSELQSNQ